MTKEIMLSSLSKYKAVHANVFNRFCIEFVFLCSVIIFNILYFRFIFLLHINRLESRLDEKNEEACYH